MLHSSRLAAHLSLTGIVAVALVGLPAPARAADPAQEAATAGTHAGLAAKGTSIEQVHMHLHHTVNCLEGPKGKGFDAKEANPCEKLGNGAIPDATDAALKEKMMKALARAEAGIKSDDLAAAQKDATEAQAALK